MNYRINYRMNYHLNDRLTYRIMALCASTLILASSLSAFAEVEVLRTKAITIPDDSAAGFLEGPSYGEGSLYYFQRVGSQSHLRRLILDSPEKGAASISPYAMGGSWFHQGTLTGLSRINGEAGVIQLTLTDGLPVGEPKILVKGSVAGRKLIGPNDIVRDPVGGHYFTDKKGRAVYYISKDGHAKLIAAYQAEGDSKNELLDNPNGIILSKDGGTLYVTDNTNILHASIAKPGKLAAPLKHLLPGTGVTEESYYKITGIKPMVDKRGRPGFQGRFGTNMRIDGMTVGPDGVIYGAGLSTGIVYGWDGESGRLIRIIKCPGAAVNCTFGGKDGRTLYVVGKGVISFVTLTN